MTAGADSGWWMMGVTFGLAYLLGATPFGLLLVRAAGLGDIRSIGSGNIGATNVLRTGRKGLALATLILDSGKGAAGVLLAFWLPGWLGADPALLAALPVPLPLAAALGAVLGHLFPVWLGFKGGKGVATTLGVLLAAAFPVGLIACATWLVMAFLFRYSSLSALVAIGLAPGAGWRLAGPERLATALVFLGIALLVFIAHRSNIRRLLRGEEPRIGAKKKTQSPASETTAERAEEEKTATESASEPSASPSGGLSGPSDRQGG